MLDPFQTLAATQCEIRFSVTPRMTKQNGNYNSTKKRVLEIFQDQEWFDVPTIARKVGIRPVRRAYTYLAHLEDLGLLVRSRDVLRKLHFQITPRGVERLQWLRSQDGPTALEQLLAPFLRKQ